MSPTPSQMTLIDTHITAIVTGVVIGEMLSYISFDLRLIKTMLVKRHMRAMPIAYLISRYTMAIGITILAWFTIPIFTTKPRDETALHYLRCLALPLLFTSTSAVLGYRALILHFQHPRVISLVIRLLLFSEFVGGLTIMILSVADPSEPTQRFSSTTYVYPAWICAPLLIALLIDLIFTLLIAIPILRGDEKPKRGEVVHMFLSDATFFGLFSIVVKIVAIGFTVKFSARNTNPYLPVRVEAVASAIFACRIFRSQERFLRGWKERKAQPSLGLVEPEPAPEPEPEGEMEAVVERSRLRVDVERGEVAAGEMQTEANVVVDPAVEEKVMVLKEGSVRKDSVVDDEEVEGKILIVEEEVDGDLKLGQDGGCTPISKVEAATLPSKLHSGPAQHLVG